MNVDKRTFNPLLGNNFRYEQGEDASLIYKGNWKCVETTSGISTSSWTLIDGSATLSGTSSSGGVTRVTITGDPGENTIVNKVTFGDGQIDQRTILVNIVDNDEPDLNDDYGFST